MCPKPDIIGSEVPEILAEDIEPLAIQPQEKIGAMKIKRHTDFTRMEKPFGLELHTATGILVTHSHLFAAYAFYLMFTGRVPFSTLIFDTIFMITGGLGITVGCHRYWSHRTFKANKALQTVLMMMQTMALQYPIHKWSLDHRIHHKVRYKPVGSLKERVFTLYYTDKDPHNSLRGLFFSHIGWLYTKKHPEFQKTLDTFEVDDLERDPIVKFQSRWYWTLVAIFHTIIPVTVLYYVWGLPLLYCIAINYRRYVITLHATWSVNSFAHLFGDKPYDESITSSENPIVAFFAGGEGWHNYHHTFPWDYKASEYGWKINMSTMFIDFFAWLGWATDMKTVSQKMLKQRLNRTGDGSHPDAVIQDDNGNDFDFHTPADVTEMMNSMEHPIWGWDDVKMTDEFRNFTKILNPEKQI